MEQQLIRRAVLERVRPLADLQLPPRVENALIRHGIGSVGQLIARSQEDLLTEVRGFGTGSAAALVEALAREGLILAEDAGHPRYPLKTRRHVLNHYAWLDPLPPAPVRGPVDQQQPARSGKGWPGDGLALGDVCESVSWPR